MKKTLTRSSIWLTREIMEIADTTPVRLGVGAKAQGART